MRYANRGGKIVDGIMKYQLTILARYRSPLFSLNKLGISILKYTWAIAIGLACSFLSVPAESDELLDAFRDPPREFSLMPFWFWNDRLNEQEIVRQIASFEAHGVYGFVIHPRVGLPKDIGWLSPRMIHFMHVAIDEAKKRGMYVVLYDEGMYPSGSSSGQVVARNPAHAARGLFKIDLKASEEPTLKAGEHLVTVVDRPNGNRMAVVDRPSGGVVRGLHYVGEGPREETPPAADILNPDAVDSFIHLVYDRYADEFGEHFGKTVLAIFTDEPSMLGRGGHGLPGTCDILPEVNRILGYDFTPYLADLWYHDRADSARRKADYLRAVGMRLEETYYARISRWCSEHHIPLTGHPGGSMDIGMERYFQMPGQDLVWRYVTPGKTALEGAHSTMAKCASSAMTHLGRRRNSNELYGAYGHATTFDEVKWLANWCFVRGQNLLYPHAFFYSVRGPRLNERPPDVGPNSAWWGSYKPYADACRRICWVNTDSKQVCDVAVLGDSGWLPDQSAKVLYQHQRDFNYLELRHLWEDARVDQQGVHLAGMHYRAVVLDGLPHLPPKSLPLLKQLAIAGRLVTWKEPSYGELLPGVVQARTEEELIDVLATLASPPSVVLDPPTRDIRVRHVIKGDRHFVLLFNEESETITTSVTLAIDGPRQWWDPATGAVLAVSDNAPVTFAPHELKLLSVRPRVESY